MSWKPTKRLTKEKIREICDKLDSERRDEIRRMGIPVAPSAPRRPRASTPQKILDEVYRMHESGERMKQIALTLDLTVDQVRHYIRKLR